ncbi:MAG: GNAT family N-acetyltransferase [Chloroflexota bacterium]|nr:GNAT family N-acetyltransferase [Chloroflexota bacterium]
MSLTFAAMSEDLLGDAAALLALRHREDRLAAPILPARFEDPAEVVPVLCALLATEGMRGVVALRGGQLLGFLCGAPVLRPADYLFAGFVPPRSGDIPDAAYAIAASAPPDLLRRMYGLVAEPWVARGLNTHFASAPARAAWTEAWADLDFGRLVALGARATAPVTKLSRPPAGITFRLATPADSDALQSRIVPFFRSFCSPPQFLPFVEEAIPAQRQFAADLLADSACATWMALDAEGSLFSFLVFVGPDSPHWSQTPLQTPESSVYLQIAYTTPEARNAGLGAALVGHAMAWAHDAGYAYCLADWITASRAAIFWQRQGFRPLTYWLRRTVDPRASWRSSSE